MCGDEHVGLATVFGPMAPDAWLTDGRSDRRKGDCSGDMCFMTDRQGDTHGYIRGHLRLPVHDPDVDHFVWSVWVELAEDDFNLNSDHWEDPERAKLPPSPGHLATVLPYEQDTLGLPVHLHNSDPGMVPLVRLNRDHDHPLVAEQHLGIGLLRVFEINEQLLH